MTAMGAIAGLTAHQSQNAPSPRLVRAAHEFEGQMMKELLKPMTDADSLTGDQDDSGSFGTLGEFASEGLGNALSLQGGLGIATSILHSLSHSGTSSNSAQVTVNKYGNTGLKRIE